MRIRGQKGCPWLSLPVLCSSKGKNWRRPYTPRLPCKVEGDTTAPLLSKSQMQYALPVRLARRGSQVSPSNRKQILPREQNPPGQAACLSHPTFPEPKTPGFLSVEIHPVPETQVHIQSQVCSTDQGVQENPLETFPSWGGPRGKSSAMPRLIFKNEGRRD